MKKIVGYIISGAVVATGLGYLVYRDIQKTKKISELTEECKTLDKNMTSLSEAAAEGVSANLDSIIDIELDIKTIVSSSKKLSKLKNNGEFKRMSGGTDV